MSCLRELSSTVHNSHFHFSSHDCCFCCCFFLLNRIFYGVLCILYHSTEEPKVTSSSYFVSFQQMSTIKYFLSFSSFPFFLYWVFTTIHLFNCCVEPKCLLYVVMEVWGFFVVVGKDAFDNFENGSFIITPIKKWF